MLLEAKQLWKTYGSGEARVHALQGVSLAVAQGDFVALVGPSGSGKSSLLHLIGAMDTPTRGAVTLAGEDLGRLRGSQLTALRLRKVGFVFQTFNLMPTLTALENVALPVQLAGAGTRQARERARELLTQVGLADRAGHLPAQLSGGQKQRVAIARALANDPALILADEPTGALDTANGEAIMALLEELNRHGRTIMMVTHNEDLASRAGRVLRMRDGRLAEAG
ncbi:MAG TPA: ABC transporter ATP-binding protein [Symbiobacteriaceae bacterium]|nr:ABC transporter ATP-binding protein [Symbiobacteriaceae bacterium]